MLTMGVTGVKERQASENLIYTLYTPLYIQPFCAHADKRVSPWLDEPGNADCHSLRYIVRY